MLSVFAGALPDFAGAVMPLLGVAPLGMALSLDFEAALPALFAFARQASFSAAGTFAHAFAASVSGFDWVVAGLSAAGAADG